MTNGKFCYKIECTDREIKIKINTVSRKGGCVASVKSQQMQRHEHGCAYEYNMSITGNYVSLVDVADFFIGLFKFTGESYTCTRTKIGKLLSVLAFKLAKNNVKIFSENILDYNNCGTIIPVLNAYYDSEIYTKVTYLDGVFEIEGDFTTFGIDNTTIPSDIRELAKIVFKKFGAFDAYYLGQCISRFINMDNILEDGIVNLEVIPCLSIEDYENVEDFREVIDYILK